MNVRIGNFEFVNVTMDEAEELWKRFGGSLQTAPAEEGSGSGVNGPRPGGSGGGSTDMVILRKLVDAGPQGVAASVLGDMLGKRGKAMRGAAKKWAERIGVVTDPGIDPFEECRVGTQRGLRIRGSLLDIARAKLAT